MHYHTYRPKQPKKGVIVPIPKSGKDPSEPTNNKGITLMSVISKVYDSILLKRHEKWLKRVLCETQGVAQNNCSSLNTALMLQLRSRSCQHLCVCCIVRCKESF